MKSELRIILTVLSNLPSEIDFIAVIGIINIRIEFLIYKELQEILVARMELFP